MQLISPSIPAEEAEAASVAEGVEAASVAEEEEALTQAARASVHQVTTMDLSLKKRK